MSENEWAGRPIARMVALVAQRLDIPEAVILGDARAADPARARQLVMYAGCQLGISTPRIGRALNRDHASVMHGRDRIAALLPDHPPMRELVADLIALGKTATPMCPIRQAHVASLREMLGEFDLAIEESRRDLDPVVLISIAGFRRMAQAIRWALVELGEPEVAPRG